MEIMPMHVPRTKPRIAPIVPPIISRPHKSLLRLNHVLGHLIRYAFFRTFENAVLRLDSGFANEPYSKPEDCDE